MARYKIGATDGGDAGLDLSWKEKLSSVDGAVLITKRVTPKFIEAVRNLPNVIVHATCTGYGSTVLEPNVPATLGQLAAVEDLVQSGFPMERVVIRIDPIIPTPKGIHTVVSVFRLFMSMGFSRYRISMIDMYPHVQERFKAARLPLPYGGAFAPQKEDWQAVNRMIVDMKSYWAEVENGRRLRIEACAEPTLSEAIYCGCVSEYDIQLMGLPLDDEDVDSVGYQRRNCLCYSGKKELLTGRTPCTHQCLYCFWKDVKTE